MYLILAVVCGDMSIGARRDQCRCEPRQKLDVVRRVVDRKLTEETWRFLCAKNVAAAEPVGGTQWCGSARVRRVVHDAVGLANLRQLIIIITSDSIVTDLQFGQPTCLFDTSSRDPMAKDKVASASFALRNDDANAESGSSLIICRNK